MWYFYLQEANTKCSEKIPHPSKKCLFTRGILHPKITTESSTITLSSRAYYYFFFKELCIKSTSRELADLGPLKSCSTEDCETFAVDVVSSTYLWKLKWSMSWTTQISGLVLGFWFWFLVCIWSPVWSGAWGRTCLCTTFTEEISTSETKL